MMRDRQEIYRAITIKYLRVGLDFQLWELLRTTRRHCAKRTRMPSQSHCR